MKQKRLKQFPVIKYVDAICGSGKSHRLKEYILGNPDKLSLIVVPTHNLAEQFQNSLNEILKRKVFRVMGEPAVKTLSDALEDTFKYKVIICTHECYKQYCYKAAFDNEMQDKLSQFDVYVDEIPAASFGGWIKVDFKKNADENYPFLTWIEEKESLFYIKEENREEFEKYYREKNANSKDLKQLLWAMLHGAGLMFDEEKHFFCYGISPLMSSVNWCKSFVIMGAGVSRSEFLWWAKEVAHFICIPAPEFLQPHTERRQHRLVPIEIKALTDKNATQESLAYTLNNFNKEVRTLLGDGYIFATNKDKSVCNFESYGDEIFGESNRVSMASYGLNNYQHITKAAFIGCSNFHPSVTGKWKLYAELNGWDANELASRRKAAMNYEQCYQFVSRCSIRDYDSNSPQLYIVPDLATANYLQTYYFPGAKVESLGFDLPVKERKAREVVKPYNTTKGNETREMIQMYKAQGMKQKDVVKLLDLGIATVKRNWK
ncbi:DEAD/DEAH box helicase family protein [Klebsiella variicola]|uniref:DEAD/DEAH box helicase family protein n=1 Tax=Klebsiella variicola TaxID=244366 RepID=UPI003871FBA5